MKKILKLNNFKNKFRLILKINLDYLYNIDNVRLIDNF